MKRGQTSRQRNKQTSGLLDWIGPVGRFNENIARISKRCPETIALVVKCVKLLIPKVLKKFFLTSVTAVTVWTAVRKIMQPFHKKNQATSKFFFLHLLKTFFSTLRKSNVTHWQPIWCSQSSALRFSQFFLLRGFMFFLVFKRLHNFLLRDCVIFCVRRLRDFLCGEVA